jgi:hypothetical protein
MSAIDNSENKTQLQQVTEFILASLTPYIAANNIDAWQENGTIIINGEDTGAGGHQVAKWKHNAVIAIENFPHRRINPYNLIAMLAAFLIDSDWPRDTYGLTDPTLDIDPISKDNATVIIELELMDNIQLQPDENGPVLYGGSRYSVAGAIINYAETADLETQNGGAQ